MSIARPLYVHPDLRGKGVGAHFYYNPEKNILGFSNGIGNEKPEFFIPVNEHCHRAFLVQQLEFITTLLKNRFDMPCLAEEKQNFSFVDNGIEIKLGSLLQDATDEDKSKKVLATLLLAENEIRQSLEQSYYLTNEAKSVLPDEWLAEQYPEELSFWNKGESGESVMQKLVVSAADKGFEIENEDMKLAIFARIDELLAEGRELSSEQNEFWEEMRMSGEVQRLDIISPMRARPKPEKYF